MATYVAVSLRRDEAFACYILARPRIDGNNTFPQKAHHAERDGYVDLIHSCRTACSATNERRKKTHEQIARCCPDILNRDAAGG